MSWITENAVRAWLGLPAAPGSEPVTSEDQAMASAVAGVNAYMVRAFGQPGDPADPALSAGAMMLGATVFRRRNSPEGVQSLGADLVAYTARSDPHVQLLLGMNRPEVG